MSSQTNLYASKEEFILFITYRQIGKMLNAREPKIVNGPQILDKYVGESEANIRKLFADAEEEEKRVCKFSTFSFHRFWWSMCIFYSCIPKFI